LFRSSEESSASVKYSNSNAPGIRGAPGRQISVFSPLYTHRIMSYNYSILVCFNYAHVCSQARKLGLAIAGSIL
jgi:hypothetical protein